MAKINDVAEAILIGSRRSTRMGNLALQQLCYLAQGIHLAVHGMPLFPEILRAETVGSISQYLRDAHAGQQFPGPGSLGSESRLTPAETSTVEAICDQYGHMMGQDLCTVVTEQLPWLHARARVTGDDPSPEIVHADLRSFFAAWFDAPEDDVEYANRFADRYGDTETVAAELRALNGAEWPAVVGNMWDESRSRFATPWSELGHHDQLTIYRLLSAQGTAANEQS